VVARSLPATRYAPIWPYLRWAIFVVVSVYCLAAISGFTSHRDFNGIVAGDAYNYWQGQAYSDTHYRYSPAFWWFTRPLQFLPWEWFVAIWTALHLAAIAWLAPWAILFAFDDVIRGNVNTFLAVGVVLAVRGQAWTWALPLLTKVTPGVGLLYHVGRKEWHKLIEAFVWTALVVGWTLLVVPDLWPEWLRALSVAPDNYYTVNVLLPLPARLAIGAVLAYLSGRRPWLLPVAMIFAMPGLLPSSFALLAAIPRLLDVGKPGLSNEVIGQTRVVQQPAP
jgi:hypothetical protein